MTIEVWSKPSCIQCDATKMELKARGIEFVELSLTDNPEALAKFKAAGYLSAPIVVTDQGTWAGFQPEKINKL